MVVQLKTVAVRLVSFKSCKLESKTRAKVFGKVDTLETIIRPLPEVILLLMVRAINPSIDNTKELSMKAPMSVSKPVDLG